MKKIYVGNLPFDATEDQLMELFSPYGAVQSVSIVTDRVSGRSRGFGFVEMGEESEAKAAIDGINGTDLNGRSLNINEARPKTEHRGGGGGGGGGPRRGGGGGGGGRGRW